MACSGGTSLSTLISLGALIVASLAFIVSASQAETARQKLRSDVFDRRYAVFNTYYNLVRAVMLAQDINELLLRSYELRNQSYFLLSDQIHEYLGKLGSRVRAYEIEKSNLKLLDGGQERMDASNAALTSFRMLEGSYDELIELFKPFLFFEDRPWWVRVWCSVRKGRSKLLVSAPAGQKCSRTPPDSQNLGWWRVFVQTMRNGYYKT